MTAEPGAAAAAAATAAEDQMLATAVEVLSLPSPLFVSFCSLLLLSSSSSSSSSSPHLLISSSPSSSPPLLFLLLISPHRPSSLLHSPPLTSHGLVFKSSIASVLRAALRPARCGLRCTSRRPSGCMSASKSFGPAQRPAPAANAGHAVVLLHPLSLRQAFRSGRRENAVGLTSFCIGIG